jgi:hypothetical protein
VRRVLFKWYLADDTGEVKDAEAGLLLHRQRLPLELPSTGVASFGQHDGGYLRADMLRVGGMHTIYARRIQLLDCDGFSRQWFREHNIEQPAAIPGPAPPPPRQKAPIPPHNGYGSPADSARNCLSLIPKAMGSKDFKKYMCVVARPCRAHFGLWDDVLRCDADHACADHVFRRTFTGKVLRFSASMENDDPVEKSRSFVVNYFRAFPLYRYLIFVCSRLRVRYAFSFRSWQVVCACALSSPRLY